MGGLAELDRPRVRRDDHHHHNHHQFLLPKYNQQRQRVGEIHPRRRPGLGVHPAADGPDHRVSSPGQYGPG